MKKIAMMMAAAAAAMSVIGDGTFTYQGRLLTATGGEVVNKSPTIEFRLYNEPSGGSALWGRAYNVMLDNEGLFNVELSDTEGSAIASANTLQSVISGNTGNLYIGLKVSGSSGEIAPRQKILPVPKSLFAEDVKTARNDFRVEGVLNANNVQISSTLEVNGKTTAKNDLQVNGNLKAMQTIETSSGFVGRGALPVGSIILWHGTVTDIPSGWALCDGKNGTPDLTDKFVIGAGKTYAKNQTGGNSSVKLSIYNLPSHSHGFTMRVGGHVATRNKDPDMFIPSSNDECRRSDILYTGSTGRSSPDAFSILPPYCALYYIMRVE